jgi:hypothetical protein
MKRSEIIGGAPTPLIELLTAAIEAKRNDENGEAIRSSLPKVHRDWAPTAYADVLAELDDEEAAGELVESAEDEFRRHVASALFTQITLAQTDARGGNQVQERKSMLDWCVTFGKVGPWQSIRSYLVWVCKTGDGLLRIALRVGLFAQIGPRDLADMSQNKFGRLAEQYDVGIAQRACGERCVELTPAFIGELRVKPATDEKEPGPATAEREPGEEG